MEKCTITFADKLSDEEEEKMSKDLIAYESRHGIDVNHKRFAIIMRDGKNNLIGALNAFTAFAEIYIDDIWVDQSFRGKGYGTMLIQSLETHFKGKGFNNINLVTSSFQAPDFYKKCGFTAEFVRTNKKNPKLTKTFFVKYFDDEVQTQGLVNNLKTEKNFSNL
jgi:ribosomal protein S18 acetylase RimI-like enzyme